MTGLFSQFIVWYLCECDFVLIESINFGEIGRYFEGSFFDCGWWCPIVDHFLVFFYNIFCFLDELGVKLLKLVFVLLKFIEYPLDV